MGEGKVQKSSKKEAKGCRKTHKMSIKTNYKNIPIAHEKDSIPLIQEFLRDFSPELIVELGTSWGGFTLVLYDACEHIKIHSHVYFSIETRSTDNEGKKY